MSATVDVIEQIGSGDAALTDQFVHLLSGDIHSSQTAAGFALAPVPDVGSGVAYTYERWIRLRFTPPFSSVFSFRFWVSNLDVPPSGWTLTWGTTPNFQPPVNVASSIAVSALPTSDPGRVSPNAGGLTRLAGTGTQYSDWIVLQAAVDMSVAPPGPILGYGTGGALNPLQLNFAWIET